MSMFNTSRAFIAGVNINSTAVSQMYVNPLRGKVTVAFADGTGVYDYTNVSRRACFKFIIDDARSLGKFVNNVLKQSRVSTAAWLTAWSHTLHIIT